MTGYVVLARKWRPTSFVTLVGQGHVTQALTNALTTGRIPHAFLFTGIRGVGKTTTARLLARCLNCEAGVGPTPCGSCPSCQAMAAGNHPDVLEIDAASHTGVDKMREVLDMVRYVPVLGRARIYILDEVHMLSNSAFNALLKTLEEPPAHVTFIFATTEARKIPPTILSRCQRYDLRRLTREELGAHFGRVLTEEGIPHDRAGLEAVARAADGSVRDGLSLLDQAIVHGEGAVRYEVLRTLLGLTDQEAVEELLGVLLAGEAATVLTLVRRFHDGGVEPAALVGDLLEALHQVARLQVTGERPAGPDQARLALLAGQRPHEQVQMVYQVLLRGLADLRLAEDPLQALEMLLLRTAFLQPAPNLARLLAALPGGGGPPEGMDGGPAGRNGVDSGGGRPAGGQSAAWPAVTSKAAPRLTAAPAPAAPPTDTAPPAGEEPFASWAGLVSCATRLEPRLAAKLEQQLVCLRCAPGDDGAGELTLRLINDIFGPPDKVAGQVRQFLAGAGYPAARVRVEQAARGERPATLGEMRGRVLQERQAALERAALAHPVINRLMQRFEARLVELRPLTEVEGVLPAMDAGDEAEG